jgi:glutamate/aspartate transport system substrate-binding protein
MLHAVRSHNNTHTFTMGINSVADAEDKELDMQLRKLATAMLVMGMTAGLAHAEDAAPAAGSTLDKIAKNGVIVVGHRESSVPFSYYDNNKKWWVTLRTTPTLSLKPSRKS